MKSKIAWAVAAVLACSCSPTGNAGGSGGGCVAASSYGTTYYSGLNDTNEASARVAESFLVPGASGSTVSVVNSAIPLYYTGSAPTGGTITLSIFTNSSGNPSAAITGASATIQAATVTSTSPQVMNFAFNSPVQLSTGSTYWLVLDTSLASNGTNIVRWAGDSINTNPNAYSGGHGKLEESTPPAAGPGTWINSGLFGSGLVLAFNLTCS